MAGETFGEWGRHRPYDPPQSPLVGRGRFWLVLEAAAFGPQRSRHRFATAGARDCFARDAAVYGLTVIASGEDRMELDVDKVVRELVQQAEQQRLSRADLAAKIEAALRGAGFMARVYV